MLIADDEPFMQRSLSVVLRREGFEFEVFDVMEGDIYRVANL